MSGTGDAIEVVYARRAASEIEQAHAWWRANRLSAPNAIAEELATAISLLTLQPRAGARARLVGAHRVKNNLQIISSLINMQVRRLAPGSSRDALSECQTRMQAIALIQEKLYQSRDHARIPFAEYVRTLAAQIFDAVGVMSSSIRLELAIEDLHLAIDSAIPCGLVLNELITNAVKQAFPGAKWNVIKAEFDGQVVITAALSIPAGDWYTQLEGLKWDSSQWKTITGRYQKYLRCAFKGCPATGNAVSVAVGTKHYPGRAVHPDRGQLDLPRGRAL